MKGRVEVVEHLLQKSTEKEAKRMCANLLPMLAAKGQLETALVLIEAGFRRDANEVLQVALSLREVAIAKRLLALKIGSPLYGAEQESLVAAASTGDADLLRQLVKLHMKGSIKSHATTALIAAVQSGRVDAVEVLLKAKAEPEAKDMHGFRAIDYAAVAGDETMMALLRKYGAKSPPNQILSIRPDIAGRVYSEREVDRLPLLLAEEEGEELISSRVASGNTLIGGTSLGRSFRYPQLYFARIGPNRIPRDRFSEFGADMDPHEYNGPSLYGAVSLLVDASGRIAKIEVIPYVGNSKRILEFDRWDDDKRIAAVMAHRFEPGRVNGAPVATRVTLPLLVQDY
jgi:hypothetical protein